MALATIGGMRRLIHPIRVRPRLAIAMAVGALTALLLPWDWSLSTRALLGWNVGAWLYIGLITLMMARADHAHLRRVARDEAEGAGMVLALVALAVLASLCGVVLELSAAKQPGHPLALQHVLAALFTVIGSWLVVPLLFTLTYASEYYRNGKGEGLRFEDPRPDFKPHYEDFLYFSFTIAVAAQTSDVVVASARMRRWVLMHALLAFAFNAAILAFAINMAASLF